MKNKVNQNQEEGKDSISDDQLKQIREEDTSIYLSKLVAENYRRMKSEKENGEDLDSNDIFKLVIQTFKSGFLFIIGVYIFDAFIRLAFSILIIYLFTAVNEGDLKIAYVYAAILMLLWYLTQLSKQIGFTESYILASRIKSALAMLLYAKISSLTSYVIKSSELGKITNLLASDLGVIEMRMATFLNGLTFPIVLIGSAIILILRLGWPGIIGVVMVLLVFPITNLISKNNGALIQEINIYKDKRIQITTEIIEGIKYIKLYGWEIAFRRIIQGLREKEIENYKKLSLGRSLERAIGNMIGFMAALLMFVAAHYANTQLDLAKIFSTLEIIMNFKLSIFMFILGLGFYYEVKVVFGRFANIFNIENTSMIKIDPITKIPLN